MDHHNQHKGNIEVYFDHFGNLWLISKALNFYMISMKSLTIQENKEIKPKSKTKFDHVSMMSNVKRMI
jgi:hypothetical protein